MQLQTEKTPRLNGSAQRHPVVTPEPTVRELTLRAVIMGIVCGVMFGAANAYLGLRIGMTVSTSIPAAVLTAAMFRGQAQRATLLEANLAQTIGSASTALATGAIFTLPALYLWGDPPSFMQVVLIALCGGVLGISAMIPLRELLMVRERDTLPFPEGRACADVLRATTGAAANGRPIFIGMGVGAALTLVWSLLHVAPGLVSYEIPWLPKAVLAIEMAPAIVGVGYVLGPRQAGVVMGASLLSALVITPLIALVGSSLSHPLPPEVTLRVADMDSAMIWSRYVRYVGAGAVAAAGIVTVLRMLPTMFGSLRSVVRGMNEGATDTRPDLSPKWFGIAIAVVMLTVLLVPQVLGTEIAFAVRALCAASVGLFGIAFVAVAARIVGLVGVSSQPTSGITLVTLLGIGSLFAALGWVSGPERSALLCAGAIVATAASKAGDISQDLKTGQLVGATPWKQQLGQYIGALTACWAVALTLGFLGSAYGFGSTALPAPQAMLMRTLVDGVLHGTLPWPLLSLGAGISLVSMLAGLSALAFAIGVYLPLSGVAPLYLGGLLRGYVDRRRKSKVESGSEASEEGSHGVLFASGLVAGEGLAGIVVAVAATALGQRGDGSTWLTGSVGSLMSLGALALVSGLLVRSATAKA